MSDDAEVASFINKLLERAAAIRLPEIFSPEHSDALYHLRDRHGVRVVALRTSSLSEQQLGDILTYRLAQYVLADQLDPALIFELQLDREPRESISSADIHILAGTASGEILCYFTIEALELVGAAEAPRLSSTNRPIFPVEKVFGHGVYRRLRIMPDLLVSRIRELGRFAKNHQYDPLDELILRGPVELSLGVLRLLSGPLMSEIDACIGDIEIAVVKKNLDFFHVPTVLVHGVVPYAPEGSFGFRNYQNRSRYPFAFLSSDISRARLDAIEQALQQPGKKGVLALLALKSERSMARSTLEPLEGLAPLTDLEVPQQGVSMASRRESLDLGAWLRTTRFFESLSVAEAAVLGTFLERCTAAAGETIIRQGEVGNDLYFVESGEAQVQVTKEDGLHVIVRTIFPGDCFGEIAVLTGGERTADIIALTPMTLMRLSQDAYKRYLAHLVDVETKFALTALTRTHETLRLARGT